MSAVIGQAGLYRHKGTGALLVQKMCPHPDASMVAVALGEPIAVLPREDRVEGARHLVQVLDAYAATTWDASLRVRHDSRFRRTHDYVAAMLYSDGAIELLPAERDQGGYRARSDAAVITDRSLGLAEIAAAINAAFQRTTGDD